MDGVALSRIERTTRIEWPTRVSDTARIGNTARVGDTTRIGDAPRVGNATGIGDATRIGDPTGIGDATGISDPTRIGDAAWTRTRVGARRHQANEGREQQETQDSSRSGQLGLGRHRLALSGCLRRLRRGFTESRAGNALQV